MRSLARLSKAKLSIIALVLAIICLFAVNLIGWESLKLYRIDTTQNKLFTLSDATRKVISEVDDPITIKLYYTDALGARAPAYGLYAQRIQALLKHYSSLSRGKIIFEKISPEPFSDEEDRAVAAGLTAIPLGVSQQKGYLALVGANSTDDEEVIAFMSLDRSAFLEYDLTRMVHKLSKPARKSVGLLTGLDMQGSMGPDGKPRPPWLIMQQLGEFFDVKTLKTSDKKIPDNIDVLMIVSPGKLSDELATSIDQFALAGKPVIAFADPFVEVNPHNPTGLEKDGANFLKLLSGWGADIAADKVVADPRNSRRIRFNSATQPVIVNYIVWLSYRGKTFDKTNPVFSKVERLVLATPGAISDNAKAGTKMTPLLTTGADSALLSTSLMVPPDPIKLINRYVSDGKPKVLAARFSGLAKKSMPDGKNAQGMVNVVVVADSDMLFDSFWAQGRTIGGQRVIIPVANNQDLLLNALENLTGGAALSGLRGRGVESRPFTLIKSIQRKAEARYRKREKVLNDKLKLAQKRLGDLQSKVKQGQVILSDEDRQGILNIRSEVVTVRRQLRGVQQALNQDIENLQFWIQLINTIGVALVILLGVLVWTLAGRMKRRKARHGGAT